MGAQMEPCQLKKLLDMALLDLQESKQTEAAALEETKLLLEEKELLEEKLRIHLDLWDVDKKNLEEVLALAKSDHQGKNIAQAFEIARLNLSLGFCQQEALRFKLRLEGALDDVDNLSSRVQVLNLQIHDKQEKLRQATVRYLKSEACLNTRMADTKQAENVADNIRQEAIRAQSLQHDLDELRKKHRTEVEKLKSDQHVLSAKRKQEVSALLREKNFVWDQLKRMEDDYCSRLKSKGEMLRVAEESIHKLQSVVEELQKAHDEKTVEVTVLQINVQAVEEEVHQLREQLSKLNVVRGSANNQESNSVGLKVLKESRIDSLSNVKPEDTEPPIGDVEQKHNFLGTKGEDDCKKKLEVSLSDIAEATKLVCAKEEELKKASKVMDELRLENQNLRMLYAELEVQFKDKQKPDKTNRNSTKDMTTRNLNAELDAVATTATQAPIKGAEFHAQREVRTRRTKLTQKHSPGAVLNSGSDKKLNDMCKDKHIGGDAERKLNPVSPGAVVVSTRKYQLRSSNSSLPVGDNKSEYNKALNHSDDGTYEKGIEEIVSSQAPTEASEAQFSSQVQSREADLLEKENQLTQSKLPHTNLGNNGKLKKVGPFSPTGDLLSSRKDQLRCHTDPTAVGENKWSKKVSDSTGNNTSRKRGRMTCGDGNSQVEMRSHLDQALSGCTHNIFAKDLNIKTQEGDKRQDPAQCHASVENSQNILSEKDKNIEPHKGGKERDPKFPIWTTNVQPIKSRLFSSVFGIPKVVTIAPSSAEM